MNLKTQTFLKALLIKSKHQEELLKCLAANDAEQVQSSPPVSFDPASLFSSTQWSYSIHYSWLAEIIKEYPPEIRSLFLQILTPAQTLGIKKMLNMTTTPGHLSPFLRPFLMDILRKHLHEKEQLDLSLLPPSALNFLLDLERKALFELMDLLGIHDLAADLRQIVDKELLKKIYAALSEQQRHFLHYCSKQPLKWIPPKLGLPAWSGSSQELSSLLHYRGLTRFAKAIYAEDAAFKWHLLHKMDTGRAKIIQKTLYQAQDPTLLSYFKNQVLHIAKRYQK